MTPIQQLEAWANDPSQDVYVSVADPYSPVAVTYRGILKRNALGFYLKAEQELNPIRGIAINVNEPFTLQFEAHDSARFYIVIYGKLPLGLVYRIVISTFDYFAEAG